MGKSKRKNVCLSSPKENWLTLATFAGVIVGIALGIGLKEVKEQWSKREAELYVGFLGNIFLNMLKCIIIPLVIPSLITAIGSMNLSLSGKVGLRAVIFYFSTTILAVILGIILVVTIRPGDGNVEGVDDEAGEKRNVTTADTLMDLIRNSFPPNIMQATLQQYKTIIIYPGEKNITDPKTNLTIYPDDKYTWNFGKYWSDSSNLLGLIVFSIVTGIAIAACGEDGEPLLKFFESVSIVMMKITTWIIHLAPIGVCFLVAQQMLEMKDLAAEFEKLGWYFLTVILGLAIHGFIVLPLIFTVICRKLPFRYIKNMLAALTTAWGTASSSATLPVTMNCLEEKNGVDPKISRFVLPIGATINMDGTALYEAVAALFIAQMYGVTASLPQILAISITATAASIGAAGIPQAGLVTMVMVLETVGLPSQAVSMILTIDWLLDRFRTAINVMGDSIGAGIVYHLSKDDLESMDTDEDLGKELDVLSETSKHGSGVCVKTYTYMFSPCRRVHYAICYYCSRFLKNMFKENIC